MKKILTIATMAFVLFGCSEKHAIPNVDELEKEVSVSITYVLDASNGGDMTKSTNTDVWDMFYEKLKSGEFVAPKYELTFTETTTGASYVFNGLWDANSMITLRMGTYHVTGVSHASGGYIQELASLSFDNEIEVSSTSNTIVLSAGYDCYLLAFAKSDITELYNRSNDGNFTDEEDFWMYNDFYYAFVNDEIFHDYSGYIFGRRQDGSTFKIMTSKAGFEKGKYYIYNDVGSDFELPPMEPGM